MNEFRSTVPPHPVLEAWNSACGAWCLAELASLHRLAGCPPTCRYMHGSSSVETAEKPGCPAIVCSKLQVFWCDAKTSLKREFA